MSNIIVSGTTGQDGSLMADYLLANTPHEIYGMVRRSAKPDLSNIAHALTNPRFHLITGDLSDSQSIDNVVKEIKPRYFINLAAQSFVGASWALPEQTFDVDAVGVLRCLESIRKHVPLCRFYNAGSSEEFGDTICAPQDETHPLRPQSPYGAAKAAARHIVRVYRESYNLYAIQGILYNHEGVRRGDEFVTRKITKAVARIAQAIKNGQSFEPLELGNLYAKRDWSDAEDFMDGIWRMLNQDVYSPTVSAGVSPLRCVNTQHRSIVKNIVEYVLSSNETHTIKEFVERAFYEAEIVGEWSGEDTGETYVREVCTHGYEGGEDLVRINPEFYRPAEVRLLHGDSSRARAELSWTPKTSFQQLVAKMVAADIATFQHTS